MAKLKLNITRGTVHTVIGSADGDCITGESITALAEEAMRAAWCPGDVRGEARADFAIVFTCARPETDAEMVEREASVRAAYGLD